MIRSRTTEETEPADAPQQPEYAAIALARYGRIPQVARFGIPDDVRNSPDELQHGQTLIVHTDRGLEAATLLEVLRDNLTENGASVTGTVERPADQKDLTRYAERQQQADDEFSEWDARLRDWQLDLQLIDLEFPMDDGQIILYVLNAQNAETTRLALLAAAAGLGIIHVQPVSAAGVIHQSGGGCGSGGCGSGGCGH